MSAAVDTHEAAGALEDVSAAQLLAEGWRDRRTGGLCLSRNQTQRIIQFTDGAPTGVEIKGGEDRFAQTLDDARLIRTEDRLKIERFSAENECPQASAVHALGLLDAKALYQALRDMARSQICEVFDWQQGTYAWTAVVPETKAAAKPFDILKMIQEELPRRWGIDRLFTALLPHSECLFELSPNTRRVADQLGATGPMALRMVNGLDGSTSLGKLLGDSAGDPLAAATLWILLHSGLVRTSQGVQESGSPAFEFEVVVDENLGKADPTSRSQNSAAATGAAPSSTRGAHPKAEAMREEIGRMLANLADLSHYDALGLDFDVENVQIKKAYFKAAKKYHPDTLARLDLDDLRDEAAQVFARIAEAFEVLYDPKRRAAYDSGDAEATEIDTARLAQAETAFRKGEILAKMGNFSGALEYLESAVELWPEEPAYQSALGWALFKQPRADTARACEHLGLAREKEPENAVILLRLGLVLRDLGKIEIAEECVLQARRIDPDVSER